MTNWSQVAAWVFGTGGVVAPTVALIRWLVKRRAGQLTRADMQNARVVRAEKLADRYLSYIWMLRADAVARGEKPTPWPRGLRPKE